MRIILTGLTFLLFLNCIQTQELNISIQVNTPTQAKLQADPKIFETLETEIREFMNSQQWTQVTFEDDERISASMQITLKKQNGSSFEADLSIQSKRPVYGTDYESQIFYWFDKNIQFSYKEFQPIRKTTSSFNDNLSSILSYYAYMIIGMDFDTYEELGGTPYFRTAEAIVNAVPSGVASGSGWENKTNAQNRYSLISNCFNPVIEKARKAIYKYHRKGLDIMSAEPEVGRENITAALEQIQSANNSKSNTPFINLFISAKTNELVNIYNVTENPERKQVYAILMDINPSNAQKIEALK